jgi:hypothetical protein
MFGFLAGEARRNHPDRPVWNLELDAGHLNCD